MLFRVCSEGASGPRRPNPVITVTGREERKELWSKDGEGV